MRLTYACICHEEQIVKRTEQDSNAAITDQSGQQKVLAKPTSAAARLCFNSRRTNVDSELKPIFYQNEQELEESVRMRTETDHPVHDGANDDDRYQA